jgi:hypothetical protein
MASPSAATGSDDEEDVSCVAAGLVSIGQVPRLASLTGLKRLCLHGNSITRVDSLSGLCALLELNLSSNAIANIEPTSLRGLSRLTSLDLASNRLHAVQGLEGLSSLANVNLSYNYLTSIAGLSALAGPSNSLKQLNLRYNQLQQLQSFSVLVGCVGLRWLQVAGNPVCALPNSTQALASVLAHVTRFDALTSAEVLAAPFDVQAAQQYAALRLQSYEPSAFAAAASRSGSPPRAATGPASAPAAASSSGVGHTSHAVYPQRPAVGRHERPPHLDPGEARPSGPAQGPGDPTPGAQAGSRAHANRPPHGPSPQDGPHGQSQPPAGDREQPGPWSAGDVPGGWDVQPPADQFSAKAPGDASSPGGLAVPRQRLVKVLLSDAAAQTSEYTPLVARLQAEVANLRQQLDALAGAAPAVHLHARGAWRDLAAPCPLVDLIMALLQGGAHGASPRRRGQEPRGARGGAEGRYADGSGGGAGRGALAGGGGLPRGLPSGHQSHVGP